MIGSENSSHARSCIQKIWSPLMRFRSSSGPQNIIDAFSREGERIDACSNLADIPAKANGLMRAQELSGNSVHGFREGKAVFRPQAVLVAMHEPPRSHEPRISVSARPNHWYLTNRFSLSHSLLRFHTRHGV